jgi:hypothetical protein
MSSDGAPGSHIVWRYSWSASVVLRQQISGHPIENHKKDTSYVTLRVEIENNEPSSSTSPGPDEVIITCQAKSISSSRTIDYRYVGNFSLGH